MRRTTDEMFGGHRIRPRTMAEINSVEMLLRSLGPLNAIALMPMISLRGSQSQFESDPRREAESSL